MTDGLRSHRDQRRSPRPQTLPFLTACLTVLEVCFQTTRLRVVAQQKLQEPFRLLTTSCRSHHRPPSAGEWTPLRTPLPISVFDALPLSTPLELQPTGRRRYRPIQGSLGHGVFVILALSVDQSTAERKEGARQRSGRCDSRRRAKRHCFVRGTPHRSFSRCRAQHLSALRSHALLSTTPTTHGAHRLGADRSFKRRQRDQGRDGDALHSAAAGRKSRSSHGVDSSAAMEGATRRRIVCGVHVTL